MSPSAVKMMASIPSGTYATCTKKPMPIRLPKKTEICQQSQQTAFI